MPSPIPSTPSPSRLAPSLARVANGKAVIEIGERGKSVRQLQTLMNDAFDHGHIAVDGTFGAAMEKKLSQYQKNHHLSQTGRLNGRTLKGLDAMSGPNRSAHAYAQTLASVNPMAPKYLPHAGSTFCNLFAEDVTAKMGAPLPRVLADDLYKWLDSSAGKNAGWKPLSAAEAQKAANLGHPTVAVYYNPSGHGHIAMVRPGQMAGPNNPATAQAGGVNFLHGHERDGFGSLPVKYYSHP